MKITDSKSYQKTIHEAAKLYTSLNGTFLITGASGLIGSCVIDILICLVREYGNPIRIIAVGRNAETLGKRFLHEIPQTICPLEQDIMDPMNLPEGIDYIVHAASNADPYLYAAYPAETMLTNILGTYHMLEYCKTHPGARLLFTSTFEVYGRKEEQESFSENDFGELDLNSIRSCYPESKRCAEMLLKSYYEEYGVDCVIARLSSVYGPTMADKDMKAHSQFIRNALAKEKIVLKSSGSQKRTYCYLMDAVCGLLSVLQYGKSGEIYNISNEKSVASIAEVAKTVAEICMSEVEVQNAMSGNEGSLYLRPQNCILDNQKLRQLGWKGRYSLKEGLTETIHILQEIRKA